MSDQIEINNDELVPIKATPKEDMEKIKRVLKTRADNIEAKRRHKKIEPSKEEQSKVLSKLPNGGIVVGKLSEAEKQAIASGDDMALRKFGLMRQKQLRNRRK